MRVIERVPGCWKQPESVIEIGEMPVEIVTWEWAGAQLWIGRFPDGTGCCGHKVDHVDRGRAVECSRRRVARGFVQEGAG